MPVAPVLVLSSFLFSVGIYGVLARRNAVLVLMSIELMLNAVNINFVVFNLLLRSVSYIVRPMEARAAGSRLNAVGKMCCTCM